MPVGYKFFETYLTVHDAIIMVHDQSDATERIQLAGTARWTYNHALSIAKANAQIKINQKTLRELSVYNSILYKGYLTLLSKYATK